MAHAAHEARYSVRQFTLTCFLLLSLAACRQFPEVDVSEQKFDSKTPYPEFIPLEQLLEEPEAEIDVDVQKELTKRNSELGSETPAEDLEEQKDPVLDRLDALRAKRDQQAEDDPIIPDELRKRFEDGITEPVVPE